MARLGNNAVVYHVTYEFEATTADLRQAFVAELTMTVLFQLESSDLTEEELQDFGTVGVLDIVHPYVRETVHTLTGRMGLPPLVLDVKQPPTLVGASNAKK